MNEIAKIHMGHKILKSPLFGGSFIVIMPKEYNSAVCTMAHFETIEQAEKYIEVTDDTPETWFQRHLA